MLLIDDDTRHRSYCLLLFNHVVVDEGGLRDKATKYGLKDEIEDLPENLPDDVPSKATITKRD